MTDTKEPSRPDYDQLALLAVARGYDELLARAVWLEERVTKLRRQLKDSEDELKDFQRSGGNYWGDMIGEDI